MGVELTFNRINIYSTTENTGRKNFFRRDISWRYFVCTHLQCVATILLSHHVLFNPAIWYIHLLIKYLDSQQPLVIKQKEKEMRSMNMQVCVYFCYMNLILKNVLKKILRIKFRIMIYYILQYYRTERDLLDLLLSVMLQVIWN